jgi:PAS domain S-box-containing protein
MKSAFADRQGLLRSAAPSALDTVGNRNWQPFAERVPLSAFERYQELQRYVGWSDRDAAAVGAIGGILAPFFRPLVDDFYAEIGKHPDARRVITGGPEQVARLKETLIRWLEELFAGPYEAAYVERRWRVGYRHVEIGLSQVYTSAALARLRRRIVEALESQWTGTAAELSSTLQSLHTLIDLDLAIIEDAYQTEFQRRQVIVERVLAQQQAEQRYRSLFENTLDGMLMVDDEGGIVAANPAACAILGCDESAVSGSRLEGLQIRLAGASQAAAWTDFFSQPTQIGEGSLPRGDGAVADVEFRAVRGFAQGLHLLSLHDVTSRKQAEERARQSERLAAIGETMAALVHESRNALQRSKASMEMLLLEIEDRPQAVQLVARAQKAQEDLHRLYEEVRQWAAPLTLRLEPCNLQELWKEVWCLVRQAHPARDARLVEEVTCRNHVTHADPYLLSQVFRNVFENALEASPPGSAVTVRCFDAGGNEIGIAISDEGPGLSPEQQRRIFEPFFTTKAKGTGLGMAIAQRIVQSHRGGILASSPHGAQIEIRLPRTT